MWSSENAIPAPIANVPQHQHTNGVALLSVTALMEPPMSGLMEPLTGADLGSRTGRDRESPCRRKSAVCVTRPLHGARRL